MSKGTIFDVVINLLLFTPLAVMFVVGTKMIVELVIFKHTSASGVLAIGAGVEFSITYWQVSQMGTDQVNVTRSTFPYT